jgi:hypothetical protein
MMDATMYCTKHIKNGNTAGSKAPTDISFIAESLGVRPLVFISSKWIPGNIYMRRIKALFSGLKTWRRLFREIDEESYVIVQHPYESINVFRRYIDICKQKKNVHFIALIHDLDSIRGNFNLKNQQQLSKRNRVGDYEILSKCDYIISHNESMSVLLTKMGIEKRKIIDLEIFDYIVNGEVPKDRMFDKSVTVAGNLMPGKCKYLYELLGYENRSFTLHLYGPGFEDRGFKNVIYHGSFPSDTLPTQLEGSFGLVWDGDAMESCVGNSGEYLRYNNPHKTSLYLASNMPVIVWNEAAIKSYIENNKAGVGVNNLYELNDLLDGLPLDEYSMLQSNSCIAGKKIRSGYYFKRTMEELNSRLRK